MKKHYWKLAGACDWNVHKRRWVCENCKAAIIHYRKPINDFNLLLRKKINHDCDEELAKQILNS